MKTHYPGVLMIPAVLLMLAALATREGAGILAFWPVSLIATGLEEIYLWATSNRKRP